MSIPSVLHYSKDNTIVHSGILLKVHEQFIFATQARLYLAIIEAAHVI